MALAAGAGWRRPLLLGLGVVSVPSALAIKAFARSAPSPDDCGTMPATTTKSLKDAIAGRLPVPDVDAESPGTWAAVSVAVAAPGLALGLAVGLAPHVRSGAEEPLSTLHMRGAMLGVGALLIATALVGAGGWVVLLFNVFVVHFPGSLHF